MYTTRPVSPREYEVLRGWRVIGTLRLDRSGWADWTFMGPRPYPSGRTQRRLAARLRGGLA